jgi:hypothetical protein
MAMLSRYSKLQISQVKRINDEMEARATRQSSIILKNQFLQAKTSKMYQTEYNRIRHHLSDTLIPHTSVDVVKKRKKKLEAMGALGLD